MVYGNTPYVEMAPQKMVVTLKVHKWHTWNICIRVGRDFYEPYLPLPSASMGNGTYNFSGEYHRSTRLASQQLVAPDK